MPVFEIPCLTPSVPGIRLHQILVRAIEDLGGEVRVGSKANCSEMRTETPITVWSEAAARQVDHSARACILATGGILGGGRSRDRMEKLRNQSFICQFPPLQTGAIGSKKTFSHQMGTRSIGRAY